MNAPARITLRRTVAHLDRFAGQEFRLTINDMTTDPDSAVIGVTGSGRADRVPTQVGTELTVGDTRWRVDELIVGDRGSVVLRALEDGAPR